MSDVTIYLKGWRNGRYYADAVNDPGHPHHAPAMAARRRSFEPYDPGDEMYVAVEYTTDLTNDREICNRAFERFNVGSTSDPVVRKYRAEGNRSLSVGDVVVIDGNAYGVARFGWDALDDFDPTIAPTTTTP